MTPIKAAVQAVNYDNLGRYVNKTVYVELIRPPPSTTLHPDESHKSQTQNTNTIGYRIFPFGRNLNLENKWSEVSNRRDCSSKVEWRARHIKCCNGKAKSLFFSPTSFVSASRAPLVDFSRCFFRISVVIVWT